MLSLINVLKNLYKNLDSIKETGAIFFCKDIYL
jgi:hypothetical protein